MASITPDTAIIHVQRADAYGNTHLWGNLGVTRDACLASRHIILTAEEIVSPEVISSDPNRVITPGFKVSAVVHAPGAPIRRRPPATTIGITRRFSLSGSKQDPG